jgi:hypothetical protein
MLQSVTHAWIVMTIMLKQMFALQMLVAQLQAVALVVLSNIPSFGVNAIFANLIVNAQAVIFMISLTVPLASVDFIYN